MSRRARIRSPSQPLYDDSDSGEDTDNTPKPTRHAPRRRISEANLDSDVNSSPSRAPLRSVNINDDAAEKRRRRKSIKVIAALEPEDQEQAEPGRSKGKLLTSAAPPPVINVPLDVMSSNFEEWMKMATDNVCKNSVIVCLFD